jgi:transposase
MAEQALVITDTVNKSAFLCFLEFTLLPTLSVGSVLVIDNWTVHHGEDVRELVERFGCELMYLPLPTYSPDFYPIKHLFAKVKAFVKGLHPETVDFLVQAFCNAVKTVTPKNVLNAFRHCGYDVEQ